MAPVPASRIKIAIFPANAPGLDPSVGDFLSGALRMSASSLGYDVISEADARAALRDLPPGALSPDKATDITRRAGAERGVFATVSASGPRYAIYIHLTATEGGGPWFAQGSAAPNEVSSEVDRLLRSVLPPAPTAPVTNPSAPTASPPGRFRLALQTEGAIGVAPGPFYNHLAGARIDRRFTDKVALGAYVGYANLKGRTGRESDVLLYLELEYRIKVSESFALPVRYANGYLPKNGPTMRLSLGIAYTTGDVDIVFEPITPMVWLTGDEAVLSLDIAGEVAWSF